jgi:hypothetical protein
MLERGVFRDAGNTSCTPGFYCQCDSAVFSTGLCTKQGYPEEVYLLNGKIYIGVRTLL